MLAIEYTILSLEGVCRESYFSKVDHIERLLGRNGTDEQIRIPLRCFDLNVALAVDEHVAMYSNEILGVECTTQ